MADSSWNFSFLPPEHGNYNSDESVDMLIYSTRATAHCSDIQTAFVECRSGPYGKVVEPGACRDKAESLISCFNR